MRTWLSRLSVETWFLLGLLLVFLVGWTVTFFGCPGWFPP